MDKLEKCERETIMVIDELTGMCKVYTTIQSDIRKFKSKNWPLIKIEYYDPDTQQEIMSCTFEAPRKFLYPPKEYSESKPKRKVSENAGKGLAEWRQKNKSKSNL